jgi:hypothetical protein
VSLIRPDATRISTAIEFLGITGGKISEMEEHKKRPDLK